MQAALAISVCLAPNNIVTPRRRSAMPVDQKTALSLYQQMLVIRNFEETMAQMYIKGKTPVFDIGGNTVPGEMHLAVGQEPVAVGVCAHLRSSDAVTGPHRAHHFAIAKGVDLKKMAAEIFGKETGLGKGKGGHMHLFDPAVKFGCSGIIAAGMPVAVGAALRSEEHTSELQSRPHLVCRLLLEKKKPLSYT